MATAILNDLDPHTFTTPVAKDIPTIAKKTTTVAKETTTVAMVMTPWAPPSWMTLTYFWLTSDLTLTYFRFRLTFDPSTSITHPPIHRDRKAHAILLTKLMRAISPYVWAVAFHRMRSNLNE